MNEQDTLKTIFVNEAQEILENLDGMLIELENEPDNREILDSVFRQLHTLKGSSGIVEFRALEVLAHAQEDLLDYLRTENIPPTQNMMDTFFEGFDALKLLMADFAQGNNPPPSQIEDLSSKFRAFLADGGLETESEKADDADESTLDEAFFSGLTKKFKEKARVSLDDGNKIYQISIALEGDVLQAGLDPLPPLKSLTHLGEILFVKSESNLPKLQEMDPAYLYINSFSVLFASTAGIAEIKENFEFLMESGKVSVYTLSPPELQKHLGVKIDDEFWTEEDKLEPGKLGDILVDMGKVADEDINKVLSLQERPVGEILVDEELVKQEDVDKALDVQKKGGIQITEFLRVDTLKVDSLVNLVGELVITNSQVSQSKGVQDITDPTFERNFSQLTKIVKELQGQTMSLRMVPLRQTFQKMARIVRDVARKQSKAVDFIIKGEDTELDKRLIDSIGDPLVHLLRNAVDHGMEMPVERVEKGKPERGTISLSATHQGGNIVIEVKDNGRGLNREKILDKAISSGLVSSSNAANLSDEQVYQFILNPGFSTAEKITNVSGRGVGLDVVVKGVESLRGKIEITSNPGEGSTFAMRLPLTLAIIDGIVVGVGEEKYIIPALQITKTIQPSEDDVFTVQGKGEIVQIRGVLYPLVRLHSLFGVKPRTHKVWEALVMVMESENKKCCLLVDYLAGHQQVVIKSLGEEFRKLKGISGGAILPDGRVGLILDLEGISEMATRSHSRVATPKHHEKNMWHCNEVGKRGEPAAKDSGQYGSAQI